MRITTLTVTLQECDIAHSVTAESNNHVILAEAFDHMYLSGVQSQSQSNTRRLVFVNTITVDAQNRSRQTVSPKTLVRAHVIYGKKKKRKVLLVASHTFSFEQMLQQILL